MVTRSCRGHAGGNMSGTFYKQCGSRLTDHVVMAKDALNVQPWRQEAGQGTGWSRWWVPCPAADPFRGVCRRGPVGAP